MLASEIKLGLTSRFSLQSRTSAPASPQRGDGLSLKGFLPAHGEGEIGFQLGSVEVSIERKTQFKAEAVAFAPVGLTGEVDADKRF